MPGAEQVLVNQWSALAAVCQAVGETTISESWFAGTQFRDILMRYYMPTACVLLPRWPFVTAPTRVGAIRQFAQRLTSSNEELSDVELGDQQLSQAFSNRTRVSDWDDATCICKDRWNLKQKAPHLSQHLTWTRVCPNAEHHDQAVSC